MTFGVSAAPAEAPPRQHLPIGLLTASAGAAMLAGALTALSLHKAASAIAVAIAPLLAVGLYVVVRACLAREARPLIRGGAVICAASFATMYFLVLAGETGRPPRVSGTAERLVASVVYLATMLGGAASALAVSALAVWHALRARGRSPKPGALAPLIVSVSIGAAGLCTWLLVLLLTLALAPRGVAVYVMAGMTLLLPATLHGVWVCLYARMLQRWETDRPPDALLRGLAALRARCGFQFGRILTLDGEYGSGRVAAVTSTIRSSTLIISAPIADVLAPDELLALLAHEAAHVELRHVSRKQALRIVGLVAVGGAAFGASILLSRTLPFAPPVIAVFATGMAFSYGMSLYHSLLTRRHEREADEYAARAAGAAALLGALERLGAGRHPIRVANRYTTHDTWERRSGRLRRLAAEEAVRNSAPGMERSVR